MWSLRWHFTNKSITGAPYSIKSYSLSHSWTLWCVLLPRVSVGKKTEGISRGQYLLLIQVGVENDIQEVFQFVIIVCVYVSVHKCLSVLLFVVGDWCLPLIPLVVAVIQPSTVLWSYCKQNVSTSVSTPLPFLSVAAKYSLLFMWPFYFAFFDLQVPSKTRAHHFYMFNELVQFLILLYMVPAVKSFKWLVFFWSYCSLLPVPTRLEHFYRLDALLIALPMSEYWRQLKAPFW